MLTFARLFLVTSLVADQLGSVNARVKGLFSHYDRVLDQKECSCNCCIRQLRRPSEATNTTEHKCTVAPANDIRSQTKGCSTSCFVVNDPIFTQTRAVDTDLFCFYHCKPVSGGLTSAVQAAVANQQRSALVTGGNLIDSECVALRTEELNKAVSADGNGKDHQLEG
eukprot:TRINITY_DN6465_c0_g1_i1.p1 TRINITY_DN6465_c0_g1~~TRINITY_DN6465_c0_g1_i1.p1  ORF type:complete len:167 (-),score=27.76 TRINITY_DN6465_c0_g1_i1:46-546(-)